jgi:hypothetical protein
MMNKLLPQNTEVETSEFERLVTSTPELAADLAKNAIARLHEVRFEVYYCARCHTSVQVRILGGRVDIGLVECDACLAQQQGPQGYPSALCWTGQSR